MKIRGRFAPSPSGRMHLGNIYSALLSWLSAKSQGGEWILRIEDLDTQRCKREYADTLENDLEWLGLEWDEGGSHTTSPSYYQSERTDIYLLYFHQLQDKQLTYSCFCRRADLLAADAPHASDHRTVYSGRCRHLSDYEKATLSKQHAPATRLIVPDKDLTFYDRHYGIQIGNLTKECGDFIIRRADGNFAYQLAVVVDDALMNITEVVRGNDLLTSTFQQIYLYRLLGWKEPIFAHLPLLMSPSGARLAKRDKNADLASLRSIYKTPEAIIGLLAFYAGLIDRQEPISPYELLPLFNWNKIPRNNILVSI